MRKLFLLTVLVFTSFVILGQNCVRFHKNPGCKVKNSKEYKVFGQSKSITADAGKTYTFQVLLFGGYDYKIGLCTEKGYEPIHIKIINADDQVVFYDNIDDDYTNTVGFSNEKTKNVIFEVTCMASDLEFVDIGDSRTCLGIAIFWHRIPLMGKEK